MQQGKVCSFAVWLWTNVSAFPCGWQLIWLLEDSGSQQVSHFMHLFLCLLFVCDLSFQLKKKATQTGPFVEPMLTAYYTLSVFQPAQRGVVINPSSYPRRVWWVPQELIIKAVKCLSRIRWLRIRHSASPKYLTRHTGTWHLTEAVQD